ncbi:MAG: protein kinase [Phycisphaerae bacterium]|nr:protein kinase [Phycisphaerae bacterium]
MSLFPDMSNSPSDSFKESDADLIPSEPGGKTVEWPREFGPFHLVEQIGAGGCGIVYRAVPTLPDSNEVVALKVLRRQHASSDIHLKRFHREARLARKLDHPRIVKTIGDGVHDNWHYLVQEYVDGGDLLHYMSDRPLHPTQAAEFIQQIAEACQHAHSRGIIHRDIKPQNILVNDGVPSITDFGLAKDLDAETKLTRTNSQPGTRPYMAPEQADPCLAPISSLCDVYSLGATLYQLLTCRTPFPIGSGLSDEAIVNQIAWAEPILPTKLNSSIPRDLETICLKCMEKWPHDRYPTASRLADDLARFLQGKPILARRSSRPRRFVRRCQRRPGLTAAIIVLTVLAAAGAFAAFDYAHEAEVQKQFAISEGTAKEEALIEANAAKAQARVAETQAGEESRKKRLQAYASDIQQIEASWKTGDISRAKELLARHARPDSGEDLRGIEWYYWAYRLRDDERPSFKAARRCRSMAFDPDGRYIALSTLVKLQLWTIGDQSLVLDTKIGRGTHTIVLNNGHYSDGSVAFSPDGRFVAATSYFNDNSSRVGSIDVWELDTLVKAFTIEDSAEVGGQAITFTPDSRYVIAGGYDHRWIAYDLAATNAEPRRGRPSAEFIAARPQFDDQPQLLGFALPVWSIRFCPALSTACSAGPSYYWDWPSEQVEGAALRPIRDLDDAVALHAQADDPMLIKFTKDTLELIYFEKAKRPAPADYEKLRRRSLSPELPITAVGFSQNKIAVACNDNIIRLWSFNPPDAVSYEKELRGNTRLITSLAFDARGSRLAAAQDDGTILIHSMSRRAAKSKQAIPSAPQVASCSSDDRTLRAVYSPTDRTIVVSRSDDAVPALHIPAPFEPIDMAFFPSRPIIAVSFGNSPEAHSGSSKTSKWPKVVIWDIEQKARVASFKSTAALRLSQLSFDKTGDLLAIPLYGRGLVVYDARIASAISLPTIESCHAVKLSPSGRYLGIGGKERSGIYDLQSDAWLFAIDGSCQRCAFSSDESMAFMLDHEGESRNTVIDLNKREVIPAALGGHVNDDIDISSDGKRAFVRGRMGIDVFFVEIWARATTMEVTPQLDDGMTLSGWFDKQLDSWKEFGARYEQVDTGKE